MKRRPLAGYTLPEILIVMAIATVVVAGVLTFFIQNLSTQRMTSGKLLLNRDIRKLTSDISKEARDAAFYRIYPSFSIRFDDTNGNGVHDEGEFDLPDGLTAGRSGDYLVLYFLDPTGALETGTTRRRVVRTVGYYRASEDPSNPTGAGPVRKHVSTTNPTSLPALSQAADFPEVVEMSRGLSDGRLFFNFGGSVVIRGELEHPGSLIRKATNTYNFTVAPRG